eukprot:422731_1
MIFYRVARKIFFLLIKKTFSTGLKKTFSTMSGIRITHSPGCTSGSAKRKELRGYDIGRQLPATPTLATMTQQDADDFADATFFYMAKVIPKKSKAKININKSKSIGKKLNFD